MQSGFPDLDYIINTNNFQKIQDCLSGASDMAMLTVDYRGNPVTRHSRCSGYCTLVRQTEGLSSLCRKCDSRGGLEAARLGMPYLYVCHMGLLDFAVPLVVSGHYTGAVLAGQVVLNDEAEKNRLEKIVDTNKISLDGSLETKLGSLYELLPVVSIDRVQVIAQMTFQITNYILEDALAKINLNEALEEKLTPDGKTESPSRATAAGIPFTPALYNSLLLKPALEYILGNFEKRISLDDMASLCNISSSYFSKLFNKITGDNFANYINRVRVDRACELLTGTDTPITVIAMDLGFEDNSYFDKVFKRLTGVTPSLYKTNKSFKSHM